MEFLYRSLPVRAMELEKIVGRNIRHWRKVRGLSQEDLAARAQLHPTYVSGIETGSRNPTVKIIGRIATALEVAPGELFVGDVEE